MNGRTDARTDMTKPISPLGLRPWGLIKFSTLDVPLKVVFLTPQSIHHTCIDCANTDETVDVREMRILPRVPNAVFTQTRLGSLNWNICPTERAFTSNGSERP